MDLLYPPRFGGAEGDLESAGERRGWRTRYDWGAAGLSFSGWKAAVHRGADGKGGIWAQPVGGGQASLVVENAQIDRLARARTGFYYVSGGTEPKGNRDLMFYDYARKATRSVMTFPRPVTEQGLSVSRDESEILATLDDGQLSQVMVVNGFR